MVALKHSKARRISPSATPSYLLRATANLLILRATNLCKQGVTGSIPVTSTNIFLIAKDLEKSPASERSIIRAHVHELCTNGSLDHLCAQRCLPKSTGIPRFHFVGSTVELLQCFALHPQLHLRILLEDLRVALAEQLCYPLVGYASGAQPCGVSGTEIVNPKVWKQIKICRAWDCLRWRLIFACISQFRRTRSITG